MKRLASMLMVLGLSGCGGGGTSGGVVAAVQAAKMGKSVVLIEPDNFLYGGVTPDDVDEIIERTRTRSRIAGTDRWRGDTIPVVLQ